VASFEDEEHEEAWRTRRGAGRGLGCAATIKHAEPELAGALKGSLSVAATRQAAFRRMRVSKGGGSGAPGMERPRKPTGRAAT